MNGLSLDERKGAVYGTDWESILQLAPYGCRRRGWYGKRTPPDFEGEDTVVMAMGRALEPVVCDLWLNKKPDYYFTEWLPEPKGICAGHPDKIVGAIVTVNHRDLIGVLEVKTAGHWVMREFVGHGLPERYIYQLQHYLWLTGLSKGFYAVMDRESGKMLDFQVDRSDKLIAQMEKDAAAFMEQVKSDDVGPEKLPLTDKRCRRCQFRKTCQGIGEQVEAVEYEGRKLEVTALDGEDALAQKLAQYAQFTSIAREADDERDRLKPEIVADMQTRKIEAVSCPGVDGGYKLSRYKTDRIDTKQLRKEQPEIAVKYTKTSEVVTLKSISGEDE